ncbi:VirD4-like conjugal transfer protein, CD1115 family [Ruminococcus albus]|nr:type IV secretory system conjugative DNA transfer family protein [Ruminococcus albus]
MVLLPTFVTAFFITYKLDVKWHVTHDNQEIKGKDRFLNKKELKKMFYSFSENNMESAEKSGIILAYEKGKYYIDCETIHSLIIGTTRSGKGQTFVLPMIRHIALSKSKHSMVLNDPKGELLENTYKLLKDNGYNVVVLNLRDTKKSSLWNPLQVIIDEYKRCRKENDDLSICITMIDSVADTFTHNDKSDPIWPKSAKALLIAMILYLLEKGYDNNCIENVSMYSVYQMFIDFGAQNERREKREVNALDELFQELQRKDPQNPAVAAYAVSRFSSGEMRSSIFSTLASNINIFGSDQGIAKLTSGNQINFYELVDPEKPMAVFMVVPDDNPARWVISSLFVNQCYNTLVALSSKCAGQKLPQRVHFILDEFGNMVRIPDMDSKITVGAGRNLLFNMFIQDLNQLDTKYGDAAKTIRSNCGNMIYINSMDNNTNKYFSEILGTTTIEYTTYSGKLSEFVEHQNLVVEGRALMTASELSTMPFGSAVTKRQRMYPIKTRFEPFYRLNIKITSQEDIAKDCNLIDMPLSDTIFDMELLWKPLFTPKLNDQGKKMLENDENGFAQPVTNWNDVRKSFEARKKVKLEKNVRTDFANTDVNESVALNSTLQVIIKKLDELSGGQFTNEYKNNNLSEVEKIIKMAIGRGKLDMTEREEIRKYIDNSHNV